MHVFIVFAHPNRTSLAGTLLDRLTAGLRQAGHTFDVSDLYQEGFDPRFSSADFDYFRADGPMMSDISTIHSRIERAQVLAFVYPVWWWSAPAILKGWYDRVLINDFAYTFDGHNVHPALSGKKVVQICIGGSSGKVYQKYGYDAAMQRQIEAGIWFYCGLTEVKTHLITDIDASVRSRETALARAEEIGRTMA